MVRDDPARANVTFRLVPEDNMRHGRTSLLPFDTIKSIDEFYAFGITQNLDGER